MIPPCKQNHLVIWESELPPRKQSHRVNETMALYLSGGPGLATVTKHKKTARPPTNNAVCSVNLQNRCPPGLRAARCAPTGAHWCCQWPPQLQPLVEEFRPDGMARKQTMRLKTPCALKGAEGVGIEGVHVLGHILWQLPQSDPAFDMGWPKRTSPQCNTHHSCRAVVCPGCACLRRGQPEAMRH